MKKILFPILILTSCLFFLTGCGKDLSSETDIDKILAKSTVLMCTKPDGTILYSIEDDEDETIDIDIPQDALLYLATNDWNISYGVWDMTKGTWVLEPSEDKMSFYHFANELLYVKYSGEYFNTQFEPITKDDWYTLSWLGASDITHMLEFYENSDNANNSDPSNDSEEIDNTQQDTNSNQDGNHEADTETGDTSTTPDASTTTNNGNTSTPPTDVVLPEKPANSTPGLSEAEARDLFWSQTYGNASFAEIDQLLMERHHYAMQSSYTQAVSYFWEDVLGVTDVGNRIEPMFYSDLIYYDAEDFSQANAAVLKVAKNEIYARHGYIFNNQDLQNYFMGCTWYEPKYTSDQFDTSVFNECEVYNLKLITELSE